MNYDETEIARWLLARDAHVEARAAREWRELRAAILHCSLRRHAGRSSYGIARVLLDRGTDPKFVLACAASSRRRRRDDARIPERDAVFMGRARPRSVVRQQPAMQPLQDCRPTSKQSRCQLLSSPGTGRRGAWMARSTLCSNLPVAGANWGPFPGPGAHQSPCLHRTPGLEGVHPTDRKSTRAR